MPSYTFVSTSNAFILRGAKIVFVDSREDHPGMDESKIESLITSKTKAIVICNPANPTGYVYSKEELEVLKALVLKHDLFLFADEVYQNLFYL